MQDNNTNPTTTNAESWANSRYNPESPAYDAEQDKKQAADLVKQARDRAANAQYSKEEAEAAYDEAEEAFERAESMIEDLKQELEERGRALDRAREARDDAATHAKRAEREAQKAATALGAYLAELLTGGSHADATRAAARAADNGPIADDEAQGLAIIKAESFLELAQAASDLLRQ